MTPKPVKHWCKNVLIALDQLGNAVIGGYVDETISARSYRNSFMSTRWYIAKNVIDTIFFLVAGQFDHCKESFIWEKERMDLPVQYREYRCRKSREHKSRSQ